MHCVFPRPHLLLGTAQAEVRPRSRHRRISELITEDMEQALCIAGYKARRTPGRHEIRGRIDLTWRISTSGPSADLTRCPHCDVAFFLLPPTVVSFFQR